MSIALLVLFLVFMFLGVPIAVSLGAASVICMVTMSDLPLSMAAQSMFTSMNSFIMVAVPLFILCGSLMDEGGVAEKICCKYAFRRNVGFFGCSDRIYR